MHELIVWYLIKFIESVELRQKSISVSYSWTASSSPLVSAFAQRTLFMEKPTKPSISTLSLSVIVEVEGRLASADQS